METYARLSGGQVTPVIKAGQIMTSPVVSIPPEMTVSEALALMNQRCLHHLPVVDSESRLVGLTSDRDLLARKGREGLLVSQTMATEVLTAGPDSAICAVARIMTDHHVNCVPVIDPERQLLGILTSLDLLACMTHQAPHEVWL